MPLFDPLDKNDFKNAKQISEFFKIEFVEIDWQRGGVTMSPNVSNQRRLALHEKLGMGLGNTHITPRESFNQYGLVLRGKLEKAICPFLKKDEPIAKCKIYAMRPVLCKKYRCTLSNFQAFQDYLSKLDLCD
jgi:Fe-S-cluster containining protein